MKVLALSDNKAVVEMTAGELNPLTDKPEEGAIVDILPMYQKLVALGNVWSDVSECCSLMHESYKTLSEISEMAYKLEEKAWTP